MQPVKSYSANGDGKHESTTTIYAPSSTFGMQYRVLVTVTDTVSGTTTVVQFRYELTVYMYDTEALAE